jgi:hypothetical protein
MACCMGGHWMLASSVSPPGFASFPAVTAIVKAGLQAQHSHPGELVSN